MPTQLVQVISLLYRMESDDIKPLEADLLDQRKAAWVGALAEKAREYGCDGVPRPPSGRDLEELRAMSREDAASIAATWNADVERQVEALYAANPRGNRRYYAANMERWAAERATWKAPSIALNTAQQTRFYAQQQFRRNNGLRGGRYRLVGVPPVCRICMRHFAAGLVDEQYVQRNPAPIHVNCPHEWREMKDQRVPCDELWIG